MACLAMCLLRVYDDFSMCSRWTRFLGGLHVTNPPIRLMCLTYVRLSVRPHFRFWTLEFNLCPIEFKLDREIDHHHSQVAFEIGVIPSVRLSVYGIDTVM